MRKSIEKMRKSAVTRPFLHSVIIVLIFYIVMLLSSLLTLLMPDFFTENGELLIPLIIEIPMCIAGLGVVSALGYLDKLKNIKNFFRGLASCGFFLVVYSFLRSAACFWSISREALRAL